MPKKAHFSWLDALAGGFLWVLLWVGAMFTYHTFTLHSTTAACHAMGFHSPLVILIYCGAGTLVGTGQECVRVYNARAKKRRENRHKSNHQDRGSRSP